ncbi:MAG: TonB-dependent receptor [Bacteroidales bacterium]|nr:TonB-dependent receptor [Bacteroidales bacterium]
MIGRNTKDGKFTYNSTDDLTRFVEGDRGDMLRYYSYFGRVNYNFSDKYLLTINGRMDYNSKFPPQNRSGFFPSVSGGWRITKEPFMSTLADLIDLKLRAGYGKVGSLPEENGAYLPLLTVIKYIIFMGIIPIQIV